MTHVQFQKPARSFNNLVDDLFLGFPSLYRDPAVNHTFKAAVPVNIRETENGYELDVVAPGLVKEDFSIKVDNNTLTISADLNTGKENKEEKHIRREYSFKSFKRSFTLDETFDSENIVAKYLNGVLTLNLPKKAEVKPSVKQIAIN